MRRIAATYVFPLNRPPLKNGIVTCRDDGTIVDIEDTGGILSESENLEHYSGLLVPGFVNAHVHLELSFLKNKIPEKTGIGRFLGYINSLRNQNLENQETEMQKADRRMFAAGIVAAGDISNTMASLDVKTGSRIYYHTFAEAFGFHPSRAERAFSMAAVVVEMFREQGLAASITPHSAYSVSDDLFQMIAAHAKNEKSILTVHNQESLAEEQFVKDGIGDLMWHMQEILKLDTSHWKPTGRSPMERIISFLPPANRVLLVHNTFTGSNDIAFLKSMQRHLNTFFVLCPNSNLYIEDKLPPVRLLRDEKMNICIGTDSLASNRSLSVLDELVTLQNSFPEISTEELFSWACINGARALNIDPVAGTIEPGKKPGINLLTGVDFRQMKLTRQSRIKRLV